MPFHRCVLASPCNTIGYGSERGSDRAVAPAPFFDGLVAGIGEDAQFVGCGEASEGGSLSDLSNTNIG